MTSSTTQWWSVGVGIMCVLVGIGVLLLCTKLGELLARAGKTLDAVDVQIGALGAPIATTLTHVGGIADTADSTLARVGVAVAQLEIVAGNATRAASAFGAVVANAANGLRKGGESRRGGL